MSKNRTTPPRDARSWVLSRNRLTRWIIPPTGQAGAREGSQLDEPLRRESSGIIDAPVAGE